MPAATHLEFARDRLTLYRQLNRFYFTGFLRSFVLALPIVCVVLPGPWRVIGYVYLAIWGLFVAASTGSLFALFFDALLIVLNRQPVMLPQVIFARQVAVQHPEVRRAIKGFHRFAALASWANPLGNLAVSFTLFALRMRPQMMARIAAMIAEWEAMGKVIIGGEPTVEYISPAIDEAIGPTVGAPQKQQREMQFA